MKRQKLKKIIAISSVVGTVMAIKAIPANATEVNSGLSVASISRGQVINVSSTLRIRKEANTNSAVLGTIKNGYTFDIISKNQGWYQIKYNGITGYVHGGCSPIGMKKLFPTFFHESALEQDFIIVSGGKRGFQIKCEPNLLASACKGQFSDLIFH